MKFFKYLAIIFVGFFAVLAITNSCGGEKDNDNNSSRTEKSVSVAKKQNKPQTNAADDIRYAELCDYTMKRGVNLCFFYREMVKMETATIKKADKVFNNNYNADYLAYQEQLYQTEKRKLCQKYNIELSMCGEIITFGVLYCE